MSNKNEAFEKWFDENYPLNKTHYSRDKDAAWEGWDAAKADSAQEIAELKATIEELRYMQGINTDYATAELQAHINSLREALGVSLPYVETYALDADGTYKKITDVLAQTPAQSLQAHDDEVIEMCAKVVASFKQADPYTGKVLDTDINNLLNECIGAIQELKGKQNE